MRTRPAVPVDERFLRMMPPRPPSGCWLWIGGVNGRGHPVIKSGGSKGTNLLVRRVAYEHFHGSIPDGHEVYQSCGQRRCMARDCLWAMDHSELMIETIRRDGSWQPRGEHARKAQLTADQVRKVRRLGDAGATPDQLARATGLTADHCRRIVSRKAWAHL